MSRSEDREYTRLLKRSREVASRSKDPLVLEAQQVADTARETLETAARNSIKVLGAEKTTEIFEGVCHD